MIAKVLTITLADGSQLRYQDVQVEEDSDHNQLQVWREVELPSHGTEVQGLARLSLDGISYFVQE